ncbi:STAS domain-containing protein, partial [Streptomyces sp. NPDC006197]|uniref:STAS domain-containing protein n=1 Tax=Streptomyces sp. NPDC006197 TaxID=3156685 RepID=UPI0033BECABF
CLPARHTVRPGLLPGRDGPRVGALAHADLAAVDALARLKLAAGRRGHRIRFHGAGPELRALLLLTGLDGTLGL